jgi:hypothetical protein
MKITTILFLMVMGYLIFTIIIAASNFVLNDKIKCKYFQCDIKQIINISNLEKLNNTSFFGTCYYENQKIDCAKIKIKIFDKNK